MITPKQVHEAKGLIDRANNLVLVATMFRPGNFSSVDRSSLFYFHGHAGMTLMELTRLGVDQAEVGRLAAAGIRELALSKLGEVMRQLAAMDVDTSSFDNTWNEHDSDETD